MRGRRLGGRGRHIGFVYAYTINWGGLSDSPFIFSVRLATLCCRVYNTSTCLAWALAYTAHRKRVLKEGKYYVSRRQICTRWWGS